MKKLLLVDGMSLIYRAYFAFQKYPRRNSRGMNTSAVYGFATALIEVLQKEMPTHRAVAFDTSAPTFRHKIYPDYKAHREKQPEDISEALPWVDKLLDAMQIPVLRLDGYEADDIIGTIARIASDDGFEVLMMTPDKDFAQLIDQFVYLYRPPVMKKPAKKIGLSELEEAYGVEQPTQVVDLLALQGDTVDNIPGVPGVGPKTATDLLKKYRTLEKILELPFDLPKATSKKLRQYRDKALLSKRLATIERNVPIDWQIKDFVERPSRPKLLRELFAFLEFKTLAKRILGEELPLYEGSEVTAQPLGLSVSDQLRPIGSSSSLCSPSQYHILRTEAELSKLLPYLQQQSKLALRLQLQEDRPSLPQIKALALAYCSNEAYVLVLPTDRNEATALLQLLNGLLKDPNIEKVSAEVKEDILALQGYGIQLGGPFFDITLAHYVCSPEANHAIDALAAQYLSVEMYPALGSSPPTGLAAAQGAAQCLGLQPILSEKLGEGKLMQLFQKIEQPLIEVLAAMETKGVLLEREKLEHLSKAYAKEIEVLQTEIYKLSDISFNISSPKQLGEVLFDKLKLEDKPKKTKTGHYATGEEVLQTLTQKHPIVEKVLHFREYQKLRSTYLEALPRFIAKDNRIHTKYRQSVAATGRLSANYPNLQNIPIRSDKGRRIRSAFVASDGYKLLSADYSQIELRILASFAEDPVMLEAFAQEKDIHRATASTIFSTSVEEVSEAERRTAKTANFGILYGISAFGLSQRLNISRKEAQVLIDSYFITFPSVQKYILEQQSQARQLGYVETHWGRRRYLPDINSRNATARAFAERNAINAPIQGTAADIIKQAMCAVYTWIREKKLQTELILQIHDELLLEVPEEEVPVLKTHLPVLMQSVSELQVPLQVSVGVGDNWLEAH